MSDGETFVSKSLKGMLWTGGGRLALRVIQFLFGIVLARILTPADYGTVGMLAIFFAVSETLVDCGFSAAFIRKRDRTDLDASTVYVFSVAVAAVIVAVLFALAPAVARFYVRPDLAAVMRVLSLTLLAAAAASVPHALLRIRLAFRAITLVNVVAMVASASLGVILALRGLGVWALVWQSLAWSAAWCVLMHVVAHYRPRWGCSFAALREFFAFGWKHLVASLVNTASENFHFLVIGRAFGAESVGNLSRGEAWARLPSYVALDALTKVNYPLLVPFQDDPRRLAREHLRLSALALAVLAPVLGAMAYFAPELIATVLGAHWLAATEFLRILAVGSLFQPLGALWLNPLYLRGRTDVVMKLELAERSVAVAMLLVAVPYGIVAVAWARSVACVMIAFVNFAVSAGLLRSAVARLDAGRS